MIQQIKTKNFKGFNINEPVHPKTIYVGKNKSGKSSRSHAIALTLLGYIPFAAKTNKKPADILNDFGVGDTLTTAIVCNDVEFERPYSRDKKGVVSHRMRVDKKKVSAADYAVALSKAGDPRIVDVNDFILMSDQKKIDALFELFPPDANLKTLDSKIDKAKIKVNELQAQERTSTSAIQQLTARKSEIEIPAGSLPEIKAEIETTMQAVLDARESLKQIEIDEAKETAKAEQKVDSQAMFDQIMEKNTKEWVPESASNDVTKQELHKNTLITGNGPGDPNIGLGVLSYPAESIQAIIDTMIEAGCETCAALLVAKMELKKFKGGVK